MSGIEAERPGVRKADKAHGDDTTLTRFVKDNKPRKQLPRKQWTIPGWDRPNASIDAGRSLFHRRSVKAPAALKNVLVSGHSNVKIGRDVRKGSLRGYWIYTLSLEERVTCPRSCQHWRSCYGNNMPWAKRVEHGPELEQRLRQEVAELLAVKGRRGVLVRLHALGDFYSSGYVRLWEELLDRHSNLAIFGYTARHPSTDSIGQEVARVKAKHGRRFAVRWSNGGARRDCTVSVKDASQARGDAFLCPEQTSKTLCCATCAACWSTDRNVAFVEH